MTTHTPRWTLVALMVFLVLVGGALPYAAPGSASPSPGGDVQRHHYAINARVRPLVLFWISRSDVGDAVVTRRQGATESAYSLLIGSDPDRAPRRINRWGYIEEEIRGGNATLIGLMTESEEDSIEQAEANIRKHAGDRTFKIIRATVAGDQARSIVTSIEAPSDYSFRHVHTVLDLAQGESSGGKARVIRLPSGTRPGFLAALAEIVHSHVDQWRTTGRVQPGAPLPYVYHGHIYELAVSRTQALSTIRVGTATYAHVITSQFEIRNTSDGSLTPFSMTYGADGRFAETTLAAAYQPRWWLQIELTLDDTRPGPSVASGLNP